MHYAVAVHSSETIWLKIWKSNKCAQLGCTVHCGKFKPVGIVVIDKTASLRKNVDKYIKMISAENSKYNSLFYFLCKFYVIKCKVLHLH